MNTDNFLYEFMSLSFNSAPKLLAFETNQVLTSFASSLSPRQLQKQARSLKRNRQKKLLQHPQVLPAKNFLPKSEIYLRINNYKHQKGLIQTD